jgi:hypothetical protein
MTLYLAHYIITAETYLRQISQYILKKRRLMHSWQDYAIYISITDIMTVIHNRIPSKSCIDNADDPVGKGAA